MTPKKKAAKKSAPGGHTARLADLEAAVDQVLQLWPEQLCPLQDLCEAMDRLAFVRHRKRGAQPLSDRTAEILAARQSGQSIREIARQLGISHTTVAKYLKLDGK